MKRKIRRKLDAKKRKVERRLSNAMHQDGSQPTLTGGNIHYELSDRVSAIAHGGIGAIHMLVEKVGLPPLIDRYVHVLKMHLPYYESDHVLNIAYNALCGGQTLDDIEQRRNDEVHLNALGTESIPDPTTAGDFCRRFEPYHIMRLMEAINEARLAVWQQQSTFTQETARIDADGTMVPTLGECKEGMDINYKGVWGYHPLVVTLANTQELLFVRNRGGNRPSHEGVIPLFDKSVDLCRRAGFTDILLRGDTDFSLTAEFDRWTGGGVRFVFGYDASSNLQDLADGTPEGEYQELVRKAERALLTSPRRRQVNVKEQIVVEREYKNIKLRSEEVAEFDYRPGKCKRTYRMIVVRKNLTVERGELALFDDVRYFFYITNDPKLTAHEVVREANQRCDQENVIAQLKAARALHAPVNTLNANWAYMVMVGLAWNLKAWAALMLPVHGRWREKHTRESQRLLRMEFRTFLDAIMMVPAQIVKTGRRLVYRFLAWTPWQSTFFRLVDALRL